MLEEGEEGVSRLNAFWGIYSFPKECVSNKPLVFWALECLEFDLFQRLCEHSAAQPSAEECLKTAVAFCRCNDNIYGQASFRENDFHRGDKRPQEDRAQGEDRRHRCKRDAAESEESEAIL